MTDHTSERDRVADVRTTRAKAMFPAEWERMEGLTGKPRQRLKARIKNQADYLHGMQMLPKDATCGNCKHRSNHPDFGPCCDLDSDFHGYAKIKMDHSCPRWVALSPSNGGSGE